MSEDRETFSAFVRERQASLVQLASALAGDRQLGEDLAQAALARLWPRWRKVSATGDPWPYLQRITISVASTWRRRRWRTELVTDKVPEPVAADSEPSPAVADLTVAKWLALLPPRQRAVIVLRFLADLSVEEAAGILGCTQGTVMSQTAKARNRLRTTIESERQMEARA